MIPIIARTTEELLRSCRRRCAKGALALGATRGRAVFTVILPAAAARHHHRHPAGARAHRRRDGAAAVHRVQQPVLVDGSTQPIASLTVQVLHLRHLAVRGLASPGLGRRARAGDARARLLGPRAPRDAAPRTDAGGTLSRYDAERRRHASRPHRPSCRVRTPAGRRPRSPPTRAAGVAIDVEGLSTSSTAASRRCTTSRSQLPAKLVTAFIGPSGCGKSTFLRTLNRMNDIIPGTRVDGHGHRRRPRHLRRRASTSSSCGGASGWCSRSRTRSRSRSSTTSPTACASTAWREPRRSCDDVVEESLRERRAVGRGEGPAARLGAGALGRPAAAAVHRARARRRARDPADGRAGVGARPDRHAARSRS